MSGYRVLLNSHYAPRAHNSLQEGRRFSGCDGERIPGRSAVSGLAGFWRGFKGLELQVYGALFLARRPTLKGAPAPGRALAQSSFLKHAPGKKPLGLQVSVSSRIENAVVATTKTLGPEGAAMGPPWSCMAGEIVLVLQLYLLSLAENGPKSGPEGPGNSRFFRGLKPPAPSGKSDLQL
jgi:hypothetical protein